MSGDADFKKDTVMTFAIYMTEVSGDADVIRILRLFYYLFSFFYCMATEPYDSSTAHRGPDYLARDSDPVGPHDKVMMMQITGLALSYINFRKMATRRTTYSIVFVRR